MACCGSAAASARACAPSYGRKRRTGGVISILGRQVGRVAAGRLHRQLGAGEPVHRPQPPVRRGHRPQHPPQQDDPAGPPNTEPEYQRATEIYFQRCAGCHGVLRKGATGKPLTPEITQAKGTDYLKVFIAYGSPAGMPNWLTSGEMDEKTVDVMARYIQQDPPVPPEFGMAQIKETWKVVIPPSQRPTRSSPRKPARSPASPSPASEAGRPNSFRAT